MMASSALPTYSVNSPCSSGKGTCDRNGGTRSNVTHRQRGRRENNNRMRKTARGLTAWTFLRDPAARRGVTQHHGGVAFTRNPDDSDEPHLEAVLLQDRGLPGKDLIGLDALQALRPLLFLQDRKRVSQSRGCMRLPAKANLDRRSSVPDNPLLPADPQRHARPSVATRNLALANHGAAAASVPETSSLRAHPPFNKALCNNGSPATTPSVLLSQKCHKPSILQPSIVKHYGAKFATLR